MSTIEDIMPPNNPTQETQHTIIDNVEQQTTKWRQQPFQSDTNDDDFIGDTILQNKPDGTLRLYFANINGISSMKTYIQHWTT